MPIELAPVGLFLAAAALAAIGGRRLAAVTALLTPIASALVSALVLYPGASAAWQIMDFTLVPVRVDSMALVFTGVFHLAAFLAALYVLNVRDRLQHAALLAYIGAGIGAVLAGDLVSLWFFWELIALSGALLIWAKRDRESLAAGIRYLVFQVSSGVILLAGILLHATATGSLLFGTIGLGAPGGWLILLAFGIKTGFPLLHNWIPDAYPRASLTGSAILVAVTAKVGIYALVRGFEGESLLVAIGTVMVLWPLFYALVEDDLRRVLAYSLMVQLGLMVAAVGIGGPLALDGVTVHVAMDVLFKMLLFMALGVVLLRTGTTRASALGGLARQMPVTTVCAAFGVAANSAFPFTGAYISKKLLLGAVEHSGLPILVYAVLLSLSALGMLYLGVRILYEGFLRPVVHERKLRDAPWPMAASMLVIVTILAITGMAPGLTDGIRPFASDYNPFTAAKIIGQFQLLAVAILAYVLMHRAGAGLPRSQPAVWMDTEWFYRRCIPALARSGRDMLSRSTRRAVRLLALWLHRPGDGRLSSTLARTWPTGSMALWVAILLAAMLFVGVWTANS